MKHLTGRGLLVVCIAVLVAIGAACTDASPTPTEPPSPTIIITNLQIPTPPPSPTPAPSPTPGQLSGDPSSGEANFTQCAACHGEAGSGGFAPALDTAEFAQKFAEDASLWTVLREGAGAMPAYGTNRFTDQEIADLIAYMRSLQ